MSFKLVLFLVQTLPRSISFLAQTEMAQNQPLTTLSAVIIEVAEDSTKLREIS